MGMLNMMAMPIVMPIPIPLSMLMLMLSAAILRVCPMNNAIVVDLCADGHEFASPLIMMMEEDGLFSAAALL
jgi:hypothetical protein